MTKIPVCFVTGFLGSGKTTFIERLVERLSGKKIVYLVNEFSPKDVDGERLKLVAGELVKIPGGSIFCKCLTGKFLKNMKQIGEMPVVGVVIEASGIANPRVAADMFRETGLDAVFTITSIAAIVDPRSFFKLCRTLPNIKEQIAAATHIIINKTDKFPVEKIDETSAAVRELNAQAVIFETSYCSVDIDVLGEAIPLVGGGDYAKCKDPNFCEVEVRVADIGELERLKKRLAILGDDLYRVKGAVRQDDGHLLAVDYDGCDWSERIDKVTRATEAGRLVVIASGYKEMMLGTIQQSFV